MRQVIALVQDGHVQYGLVEDDRGELVQFAEVLLPDKFGLTDAAMLGVNLINTLGLEGKAGKALIDKFVASVPVESAQRVVEQAPELPPATGKQRKTQAQRTARQALVDKGMTIRGTPRKRAAPKPNRPRTERYISLDEVVAVINRHGEGISASAIADELEPGISRLPRANNWAVHAVENRITVAKDRWAKRREPMPFRMVYRGNVRFLYPLRAEQPLQAELPSEEQPTTAEEPPTAPQPETPASPQPQPGWT